MIKLDRFLASTHWVDLFPGRAEETLGYFKLDHKAIWLRKSGSVMGGPKSFRFQLHWFEARELMEKIEW